MTRDIAISDNHEPKMSNTSECNDLDEMEKMHFSGCKQCAETVNSANCAMFSYEDHIRRPRIESGDSERLE